MRFSLFLAANILLTGCRNTEPTLFTALDADDTHITFANTLTETADQNVLQYEYTYNGGGVAVGDLNNDGLTDVYFTGNQVPDKLYLNKGNLQFDDVTGQAGVAGRPGHWKTGVTMADVNGDGWLDIYVCYSALSDTAARANQLFINNAGKPGTIPTFTEQAAAYGLDAPGTFSTQASFFDYDRDGDLDMFLVNHGNMFYSPFFNTSTVRNKRHPYFGNRLYRNEGGKGGGRKGGKEERETSPNGASPSSLSSLSSPFFTDVSEEAGIHGGSINFGLGVAVSDLTGDGWPDLYVANDYEEQDYFYVNDQHGHFIESTKESFTHMSRNTMGIDIADVNNDALPDVVTMDMLPASWERQKLLKGPDEYDKFRLMVDSGFGYQHMRNMLHINRGGKGGGGRKGRKEEREASLNGASLSSPSSLSSFPPSSPSSLSSLLPSSPSSLSSPRFAEVGQLAGISNTDWSWAALLADFDNDGRKDLYVTNGIVRDFTSMDFLKYDVQAAKEQLAAQGKSLTTDDDIKKNLPTADLIAKLPATKTDNVAFRNRDGLQFDDVTSRWGLAEGAVSTGAVYADLDNDGDLDLVVNNTNAPAAVYRNNAETLTQHQHLTIRLMGEGGNRFGVGALVTVAREGLTQTQELIPTRGFQSAVAPALTFGLGAGTGPIQVQVRWPDGRIGQIANVTPNATLTCRQADSQPSGPPTEAELTVPGRQPNTLFGPVSDAVIPFVHTENPYVDFKQEPLIPYQLSKQGPALAAADVNGDGLIDVFVGGATGQASGLFLQQANGQFALAPGWNAGETGMNPPADAVAALFFDADGDRDADLYVVRGGNEYAPGSPAYQDQLFLNTAGHFSLAPPGTLPGETSPGSCVAAADYDRDGDLDLLVGGRAVPGQFPTAAPSYLLRNTGKGSTGVPRFTVGQTLTPGMVTGAAWVDVDRNNVPDLLLVGDWMPVTLFMNQNGQLAPTNAQVLGLAQTGGLWTCLVPHDLDHDGDTDFLLGNLGTNVPWKARGDTALTILAADFNEDGRIDPILCQRVGRVHIPLASRDELLDQINSLRRKYVRYADYANATAETMFDAGTLATANELIVNTLNSSILENVGRGVFRLKPLPVEAQIAPTQGFVVHDFTGDGIDDILLAGNYYPLRVQQGRCDAGQGLLLKGTRTGTYLPVPAPQSGLYLTGDIRRLLAIPTAIGQSRLGTLLIAARNNGSVMTQRR
ncbi:VCBS repeat-containing protein [Fibrella arboris]|uniref:VCBS repeat-containing protein n=1 Tax=Fibrella arboris TaxID=3242486 RepID=UPI0035229250